MSECDHFIPYTYTYFSRVISTESKKLYTHHHNHSAYSFSIKFLSSIRGPSDLSEQQ